MKVAWRLPAALCLLALAPLLAPAAPPREAGILPALGRSMGGARIAWVNALFLRAEALRRQHRVEELPALYRLILDLDPENVAAVDYLAAVYAFDLASEAPDAEARWRWWREAWTLLEEARARRPDDPALLVRTADLLLFAPTVQRDLAPRLAAAWGDYEVLGAERLLAAARLTDDVPRRGRSHVMSLALLVPHLAADRLRGGRPGVGRLLEIGEALRLARPRDLAELRHLPPADAPPDFPAEGLPMDRVLRAGLDAVRAVAQALERADRSGGEAALARYRSEVPLPELARVLEEALAGR